MDVLLLRKRSPSKKKKKTFHAKYLINEKNKNIQKNYKWAEGKKHMFKKGGNKKKVGVVFWRGIVFVFWCHSKEKNRVKIFRN